MKNSLRATIGLSLIFGSSSMTINASSSTELESSHWQLVQYLNESGDTNSMLGGTLIDLRLSTGELHGSSGCNSYFGSYSVAGKKLTLVHPLSTTIKLCPQPVMEQEQAYLGLLSLATDYHIDDKTLVLLNNSQQPVLKYTVQQPAELEYTQWQATGINNGLNGVVSSASTGLSTAQFIDGKLTGNAGCNQYSASYTLEQSKLTIGLVMTTRMHCQEPPDIMQQEQDYLQAITGTHIVTLNTINLELRKDDGALQVGYSVKAETVDLEEGAGEKE